MAAICRASEAARQLSNTINRRREMNESERAKASNDLYSLKDDVERAIAALNFEPDRGRMRPAV
jgi:hypothetical protein